MPSTQPFPDPDPQAAERDTIVVEDETLRDGFTQIPNGILRRTDVTTGAKLTYMGLLSHAWQKGSCFPGQETLAEELGIGKRSIVRYMQELQDVGLLVVKRRGLGKTNIYVLPRSDTPRSANLALQEMPKTTHQEVPNWHAEEYEEEKNTKKEKRRNSKATATLHNLADAEPAASNHRSTAIASDTDRSGVRGEGGHTPASGEKNEAATRPTTAATSSAGMQALSDVLKDRTIHQLPAAPPGEDQPPESRRGKHIDAPAPIKTAIRDFSAEFGDQEHEAANLSQAVHLWQQSGLADVSFLTCMYTARSQTKKAVNVHHRMPYFFACLKDELGLAEPEGERKDLLTQHRTTPSDALASSQTQANHLKRPRSQIPSVPAVTDPPVASKDPLPASSPQPPETNPIWAQVLSELQLVMTPANFNGWLAATRVQSHNGQIMTIAVPNDFHKDWIEHKLMGRITSVMQRLGHDKLQLAFVVHGTNEHL